MVLFRPVAGLKLDGVRGQLHFGGGRAEIFSRDLRPMSGMFPEICRAAAALPGEGVLEGDILAFEGGRVLGFEELPQRLSRSQGDLFCEADHSAVYRASDCLWQDGHSLLREPLARRRRALESWTFTPPLELGPAPSGPSGQ
jgi:DNA ligase-1